MAETPLQKAMRLHRAGKVNKAREIYRRILKKNPDDAGALQFYGILLFDRGETSRAVAMVKHAVELLPGDAGAHINLGNIYLRTGELELAREHYEQALSLEPGRVEVHNNLGILLRHLRLFDDSIEHLNLALQGMPGWVDAQYNLANTCAAAGRPGQAIEYYRKVLAQQPRYPGAIKCLGSLLYAEGRLDEAERLYRESLQHEPDDPELQHLFAAVSGRDVPQRAASEYIEFYFDRFAESFDAQLESLDYRAPKLIAGQLESALGSPEHKLNILDAGCGTGLCGPLLRDRAARLVGVDLSEKMLTQARRRGCYDLLVRQDIMHYLHDTDTKHDVVVAADTLIYFGDFSELFNAVSGILTARGLFCFTTELLATDSGASDDGQPAEYNLQPHGRYAHSARYIERLAQVTGFEMAGLETAEIRKELGAPVNSLVITLRRR